MNRLFPAPAATATYSPAIKQARLSRNKALVRTTPSYSLFSPLHYEENYAYPLLIWLHNDGGNERQLPQVMPLISSRNYVGLSIRGTEGDSRHAAWSQSATGIVAAQQRLAEGIAKARERFNVNPDRVFLAGYEAGGTMAVRLALRDPAGFAGAISINGPFPEGQMPLARLSQARKFPMLVAHCRDSRVYTIDRICQELQLFHTAGLSVALRQYPCPDELTTQMLDDVDRWLMQHITGIPADEPQPAAQPGEWN
ncbi:MAG: hypothetical protein SFU86_09800 [Pirellulaceae bacterium]|nr:hypothetical protein [Pirellulaceae bacterium]